MVGSELGSNQHLQVEREIATRKDEEKMQRRLDWWKKRCGKMERPPS